VQRWIGLWRALTRSIDAVAPDIYGDDSGFVHDVLGAYHRPDNPLLVSEIAKPDSFAKYDFLAIGHGAVGIAPFGVDPRGWNILGDVPANGHARNFALLSPMVREIATLNFEGELKTSIEESGQSQEEMDLVRGKRPSRMVIRNTMADALREQATHTVLPWWRKPERMSSW
jgi:hypothetical protein